MSFIRTPPLPQGQAAREGLMTAARKRQQVADVLKNHVSLLCMGKRYADIEDEKLLDSMILLINNKWG